MSTMFCIWLSFLVFSVVDSAIDRPRGVPKSRASFYKVGTDNTFTCLSDGVKIRFDYINDDYCDCDDGSDEPGTSACQNAKFFCENKGHVPEDILSSRVNDGVCDCCDGSDEYLKDKIQCTNTCDELGRQRRDDMQREKALREAGYKIRQQYVEEGGKERENNKAQLEEYEKTKESLNAEREELERKKNEVEAPEKEAKEKHEKAWEEVKAERQAVKDREKGLQAFQQLDTDSNKYVSVAEMVARIEFDIDSDGTVSEEEAKEYLEELEQAGEEEFMEKIWPNIKEIYKFEEPKNDDTEVPVASDQIKPPSTPPEVRAVPPILEDIPEGGDEDDDIEEHFDDHDYDDDDEDDDDEPEGDTGDQKTEEEEKMPDYDEETKQLMEAADEARRQFDEADKKVKDIESQINTAKKYLENDFGPEAEFAHLYNKCFEYTDREYTYKLCPFEKASQRPKSGGSETSLGRWGHWDGGSEDNYSAQKYEKGQNCWNGPDRSVKVLLQCGSENAVLSASEPSRCEYQFEFSTPARCTMPAPGEYHSDHDEL